MSCVLYLVVVIVCCFAVVVFVFLFLCFVMYGLFFFKQRTDYEICRELRLVLCRFPKLRTPTVGSQAEDGRRESREVKRKT